MKRWIGVVTAALGLSACQGAPPMAPTAPAPPPIVPVVQGQLIVAPTSIAVGESVVARVEMDAPRCFPNWDSLGRCRQFELSANATGTLAVTMTWSAVRGEWDPELFLADADGFWLWAGERGSPRTATISVDRNRTYYLIVMSYLPAVQEIELSTELR